MKIGKDQIVVMVFGLTIIIGVVLIVKSNIPKERWNQPQGVFTTPKSESASVRASAMTPLNVAAPTGSGARIIFKSEEYDWGSISEGEKVSHVFAVCNEGMQDLRIKSVKPSCGCTVAKDYPAVLKPGECGDISFIFDSAGRKGEQHKTISVESNDPGRPSVRLKISGDVVPLIDVIPSNNVNFGRRTIGEGGEATFEVIPRQIKKIKITGVEFSKENFDLTWEPVKKEDGTVSYLFKVKLKKDVPIGNVYQRIKIMTDVENMREVYVSVYANVRGMINAVPARVTFSAVRAGQPFSRQVRIEHAGGKAINVLSVTSDHKEIKAKLVGPSGGSTVNIDISGMFDKVDQNTRRVNVLIDIKIDDPVQKTISVPVFVYFNYGARRRPGK